MFPWCDVGKKHSYADVVQSQLLSGASRVPIGTRQSLGQNSPGKSSLTGANRVLVGAKPHSVQMHAGNSFRQLVFERVQFPHQSRIRNFQRPYWRAKRGASSIHPLDGN